jgi:carotenoid cleavage dioxygenase-like enzyme
MHQQLIKMSIQSDTMSSLTAPASGVRQSPFLRQNWEPVKKEYDWTAVLGTYPTDLPCGTLFRTGPNPYNLEALNTKEYHFFAGDGMVHGLKFNEGQVSYSNRFVRTGAIMMDSTREGLGNTAVVYHNRSLYACDEGSKPYQICPESLDTLKQEDFGGKLKHNFSAHPKVCARTREMHWIGYGQHRVEGSDAFTHYSVVDAKGMLIKTIPIHFRKPTPLIHDMAITRNHAIFMDFPLYNMNKQIRVEDKTMFGILPRSAVDESDIVWIESDGMYGYHVANAWEHYDEKLCATVIDLLMVTSKEFHFQRSNVSSLQLRHFRLNVDTATQLSCKVVSPIPCDFPIIDNRKVSTPTKYIYASRLAKGIPIPLAIDGLIRYDVDTGETMEIDFPDGVCGGEAQFVPRIVRDTKMLSQIDGDGYLLVLRYNERNDESELAIYDAQSMSNVPKSLIKLPHRVPYGFHALWTYNDNELHYGALATEQSNDATRSKL